MIYGGSNFPWTIRMLPSTFGVYDSLNNLLWTCPVINIGLFTGAYLRIENTGDLVLYDVSGNLQWYQGEKYLSFVFKIVFTQSAENDL